MDDWQLCCMPGCDEEVASGRAALFPPNQAPCLNCGEKQAQAIREEKSKSVVIMHKSNMVYAATAQFAKEVAQMRSGTGGE